MIQRWSLAGLLIVFFLAMGVGIWQFIFPLIIDFGDSWIQSSGTLMGAGGIVIVSSCLAMILLSALAVYEAVHPREDN